MKAAAGIATLLAHAVAFLGLGNLDVHVEPTPDPPLEVTTIELVELPVPAAVAEAEPILEAEPMPESEPAAAPEPKHPAPPSRPPPPPRPAPTAPSPSSEPAVASTPAGPTATSPAPTTAPATPAGPRKLGKRFSNASPPKGQQRSAAKRCAEPIVKPVPTQKVKPKFPAAALRSNISGDLVLRASVDRTGAVSAVKVVKSPGALVELPAKTAFAQWRFSPATACGKSVSSTYAKKWTFSGG